jgi:pimeloyl-ACP methyl ester carboxylesterase
MSRRIETATRRRIPVAGGHIICYHMPGRATASAPARASAHGPPQAAPKDSSPHPTRPLPVLFIPGWGGVVEGFEEVIEAVDADVELYYLETREKGSSAVSLDSGFSMEQFAADVRDAVRTLGLPAGGYVLMGSSFGAAVALETLAALESQAGNPPPAAAGGAGTGRRPPAATVLFEPMAKLWLPRLLVKALGTLMPVGLVALLRPALKRLVLGGMGEEVQRARAELVIDSADLRKWRRAALRLADWHILDIAPDVDEPVVVIQASGDRFHDESVFPEIADALPAGRLYRLPVLESKRERLMGRIASVYARGGEASMAVSATTPRSGRFTR